MKKPKRPYVICHMVPSVDGRIDVKAWNLRPAVLAEYDRTAATLDAHAWMVGRVSMEPYAGEAKVPARKAGPPLARTDFVARRDAESYAVALDPSGKLTWRSGSIDDDHVVAVLAEAVPDDYLAFLQAKGVSYVFGGKTEVDLARVAGEAPEGVRHQAALLEGGGKINGAFLAADLVDELSVLMAPIADGGVGTPSLFDAGEGRGPVRPLKLVAFEKRKGDLMWLRYKTKR